MGCSSCKKPGIVVVRQPSSTPRVDKSALLAPLAQKRRIIQPVVQGRKLKSKPLAKQMGLGTVPGNVCPLCHQRLQPVSQGTGGRVVRLLKCNTSGCGYKVKI